MKTYAAPNTIQRPDFVFTEGRYDHEATSRSEAEYLDKLRAFALRQGTHPLAGKIVRQPYADGYAMYMVAKIQGRVSLIHIPIGDAWSDPQFERLATVTELRRIAQ